MDIQLPGPLQATLQPERGIRIAPSAIDTKAGLGSVQEMTGIKPIKPAADEQQVAQALKSINDVLQSRSPNLEFSVDNDSHRTIVKVVDKNTLEVIRQMPTQEALEIAKALDHLQSMLIRETA
ncbi:MAG: flagellar protein FlaG [Massilia sp.]|nr:flagellar protein FlaG [Massilia sp.]